VSASTASLAELEGVARQLGKDRFDDHAARGLGRAFDEYVGRRRRPIGPLAAVVDGRSYPSLYAAIVDPAATFGTAELRLIRPPASDVEWEYLLPFSRIVFHDDGSADVYDPSGGSPRRAIARILLREHYLVRSKADDAPDQAPSGRPVRIPSLVGTVAQGITICRAASIVPFEVALLLYLAEERARYEVDLVNSTLLADPRAGRLALSRRVRRSSRVAWGLDRKIGRGHLSLLAARCLEVLVESNGLTSIELRPVFGGVRELVESALQGLVRQRYATFDPRTGVFRARIEAFLPPAAPEEGAAAPPVRPELRTSVQELIAAADAHAACPLCGRPLPEGPRALLCDDCMAKVGLA
jgi:hypothetical protein